jgi:hypothetical protein
VAKEWLARLRVRGAPTKGAKVVGAKDLITGSIHGIKIEWPRD